MKHSQPAKPNQRRNLDGSALWGAGTLCMKVSCRTGGWGRRGGKEQTPELGSPACLWLSMCMSPYQSHQQAKDSILTAPLLKSKRSELTSHLSPEQILFLGSTNRIKARLINNPPGSVTALHFPPEIHYPRPFSCTGPTPSTRQPMPSAPSSRGQVSGRL